MSVILHALLLDVPEVVESERLVLEATRPDHGAAIHAAVVESHAQLKAWMPWAKDLQSAEETEGHCRVMQARWYAREEIDYCFVRRSDRVLVGKGGLHTIDWSLPRFEIGYWIRTSCARQGFATEAAGALAHMARRALGAVRLEIASDARNAASRRVAEKAGFVLEGIRLRSRRDVNGELADSCMYARVF